jgi:hypothetical protein
LGLVLLDQVLRLAARAVEGGVDYEHVCEVLTAFGRLGASTEAIATEAANEARAYLASRSRSVRISPISSSCRR